MPLTQEKADLEIPFLNEDIPLYVDPFMLRRSPAQSEKALHTALISSFNVLRDLAISNPKRAVSVPIALSECEEIGLGVRRTRSGRRIERETAEEILLLLNGLPDVERQDMLKCQPVFVPRFAGATVTLSD